LLSVDKKYNFLKCSNLSAETQAKLFEHTDDENCGDRPQSQEILDLDQDKNLTKNLEKYANDNCQDECKTSKDEIKSGLIKAKESIEYEVNVAKITQGIANEVFKGLKDLKFAKGPKDATAKDIGDMIDAIHNDLKGYDKLSESDRKRIEENRKTMRKSKQ